MKTLLVLRHAKSSWKEPGLTDHERPLNKRGRRDAPRMGALLRDKNLIPDLIFCSTALRARETAELVAVHSGYPGEIHYETDLYMASPEVYLRNLLALGDDLQRVMVIGHNPGVEVLVSLLTGQNETMPTAALAVLELPIQTWLECSSHIQAAIKNLWRPKELS